jgi:hypothetical protein
MSESKGNIQKADPEKGQAVQSVTTETPHPADESSAPGPYDGLELNRPPVSTNRPDVPIAHSLVGGAGAPTGPPEYDPSDPNQEPGEPRSDAGGDEAPAASATRAEWDAYARGKGVDPDQYDSKDELREALK